MPMMTSIGLRANLKFILVSLFVPLLLAFTVAGCSSSVNEAVDKSKEEDAARKQSLCAKGECPCDSPLGPVAHGSKVTVYDVESVGCEQSCSAHGREATCRNGEFDVPIADVFFSCRANQCSSCSVGDNLVRHGESIELYSTSEPDCNESCEDSKQVRVCNDGVLSGSDTFNKSTCQTKVCRCRLPEGNGYLSLGGTMEFYSKQQATCGTKCDDFKVSRDCSSSGSGTTRTFALTQADTFKYQECKEAEGCYCTLPNGLGVIAHGDKTKLHTAATAACGETCAGKGETEVTCDNGKLKVVTTQALVDIATTNLKYQCKVDDCAVCKAPDGTLYQHGTKAWFYKSSTPSCGVLCNDAANGVQRTCNNGAFTGDPSFTLTSCKERTPCKCTIPDNVTQSVPSGSSQIFYSSNRALCGTPCTDMASSRTCVETDLGGGTYSYAFGAPTTHVWSTCGKAVGCACTLPGTLGSIANGKSTQLSAKALVTCGESCDNTDHIDVLCVNGELQKQTGGAVDITLPGFKYVNSCKVAACTDCRLKNYAATIPNGTTVTLYKKDKLDCGEQQALFAFDFSCDNGALKKNGQVYIDTADPDLPPKWFTSMIQNCAGCPLPWGGSIGEGMSINAYKARNAAGNTCGTGCLMEQKKCIGGQLSGDPTFDKQNCPNNNCTDEGGGAPPRLCLLPWQNSYVTPGSQIPMYSKRSVPCGDSCQNYFALGKCIMETGRFDVGFEYIYQSCTETCSK